MKRVLLPLTLAGAVVAQAQVNPPSWWGIHDGKTTGISYDFDDGPGPSFAPDFLLNPYGTPTLTVDGVWNPTVTTHSGVVGSADSTSAVVLLDIPNQERADRKTILWMQMDWYLDDTDGNWLPNVLVPPGSVRWFTLIEGEDIGGIWRRATLMAELIPQPNYETVRIYMQGTHVGTAWLDNFHVGTHSVVVPEPCSLLALGLAGIFGRRRKQAV